jgi:hypothetical protein
MGIEVVFLEKWEYTSVKVEAKGFMGGILDISHFDNELNNFGERQIPYFRRISSRIFICCLKFI